MPTVSGRATVCPNRIPIEIHESINSFLDCLVNGLGESLNDPLSGADTTDQNANSTYDARENGDADGDEEMTSFL